MGEFNVDKTNGNLIPTAGYGGMIKINGTTLADLITALNGITEDQKNRCEILLYLNSENYTNFFVLKRYNENVSTYGSETHDIYSTSHDEVTIYDGTTKITHFSTSLHITNKTTAKIMRVSGSNGYDLTSNLSSWSILYQDDSVTGGNTYPASQVLMSDGETNVENAVDKLNDLIHIGKITATTNSAGSFIIGSNRIVIGVWFENLGVNNYTYSIGQSGNIVYLHLMNETGVSQPGVSISIKYAFIVIS